MVQKIHPEYKIHGHRLKQSPQSMHKQMKATVLFLSCSSNSVKDIIHNQIQRPNMVKMVKKKKKLKIHDKCVQI